MRQVFELTVLSHCAHWICQASGTFLVVDRVEVFVVRPFLLFGSTARFRQKQ
jgi:hypothetical protein